MLILLMKETLEAFGATFSHVGLNPPERVANVVNKLFCLAGINRFLTYIDLP
jgi:hypothetical protein